MASVFSINGRLFDKSKVDAYLDCDSSIPTDVANATPTSPPRTPPRSTPTLTDASSVSPLSSSSSLLPEDYESLDAACVLMCLGLEKQITSLDAAHVLMRISLENQLSSPDATTSPLPEPPTTFIGLGEGVPLPPSNRRTRRPSRKMREKSSSPAVRTRRRQTTPPPAPPPAGTSSTPSAPAVKKRKFSNENLSATCRYGNSEAICAAIISRPDGKMSLSSIQYWISCRDILSAESEDPEIECKDETSQSKKKGKKKNGKESWKSSVRHFLTTNRAFKNVPRSHKGRIDDGDRGSGGLWIMDMDKEEAHKLIAEMRGLTFAFRK